MSLNELLSVLQNLPRVDKLRLVQFLIHELAREEGVNLLEIADNYPIWSPYKAFEAGDILLEMLTSEQTTNDV